MKFRMGLRWLLVLTLFAAVPAALATTTWYVNGVSGSDSNSCLSSAMPCKTIGHAISLAASGDSSMVAAATYTENLTIGKSLNILGSGATTTIIDGGGIATVVTVSNTTAHVTLSKLTIQDGQASNVVVGFMRASVGGGINNSGTLRLIQQHRQWEFGIHPMYPLF